MDKERAINVFTALRMVGIPIDSVLVRALALRHGWEPDAADRLERIACKVGEGRGVKGGDRMTQTKAKKIVARLEREPE